MSSNVVRCHKHDCSQRLNRERRRREVNKRKERRYVRQKGKSLRIRHQKRAGGQARQNHAEQRELKPPVFSCLPLFYSKTFIRPVFRLDMWNFMDYEIRPLQAAISFIHASHRSQFAPVIVFQIESGLPPHSFS